MKFLPTITNGMIFNALGIYLCLSAIFILLSMPTALGNFIALLLSGASIVNSGDSEPPLI